MLHSFTARARWILALLSWNMPEQSGKKKIHWWDNLVIQEICWLAMPRPEWLKQPQIIQLAFSKKFWPGSAKRTAKRTTVSAAPQFRGRLKQGCEGDYVSQWPQVGEPSPEPLPAVAGQQKVLKQHFSYRNTSKTTKCWWSKCWIKAMSQYHWTMIWNGRHCLLRFSKLQKQIWRPVYCSSQFPIGECNRN